MKSFRKSSVIVASATIALSLALIPARAQFTVFDPTNWAEAVNQLRQLEQQYRQLVSTYNQITNQYNLMVRMAQRVPVDMFSRYSAILTPWRDSSATNTYGTTGGWIGAINSGANASAGYLQAAEQLLSYGTALDNVPADQLDRLKKHYATVELTDGANIHSIEAVGSLRQNARQVEQAIARLEQDSLSADPNMNTEIAVLNKINAASIIALRNTQDSNKLLVTLAEQQAIEAKRQRDAEAAAISSRVRFLAQEQSILNGQKDGASAAMMSFRMP